MTRIDGTGKKPLVCLVKSRESRKGRVLAVINPTPKEQRLELADLAAILGKPASAWEDLTPDMLPLRLKPAMDFELAPFRMRVLYNPKGEPLKIETPELKEGEPDS